MKRLTQIPILKSIEFYQGWISPALPASCRFLPTCSEYSAEAVRKHGPVRGGYLTLWRLLRCHPLCKGGADPVPDKPATNHPDRRHREEATDMRSPMVQDTTQQEGC